MSILHRVGIVVLVLVASVNAQPPTAPAKKGAGSAYPGIPRLEELFGDIGQVFSKIDGAQAGVLKARLRETKEELDLLERVNATLKKGIVMEVPASLRPRILPEASPELSLREQRLVDDLRAELKLRELRQKDRLDRPKNLVSAAPSLMGSAIMDVMVELPSPPGSEVGSPEKVALAANPLGVARSLFLAGDYVGALNAYESIPEEKRGVESRYRMARIREKLGQWKEAKTGYEEVARMDPKGHWGDQARWMLRFAKHQRVVYGVLSRSGKGREKSK